MKLTISLVLFRRDHEALKTAREYQLSAHGGTDESSTVTIDRTDNLKVSTRKLEQSDMVKIVKQALELRIKNGKLSATERSVSLTALELILGGGR